MPTVAIVMNALPSYRQGLYDTLIETYGDQITIYCQPNIPGMNLVTIHDRYVPYVKPVGYFGIQKEAIGWQLLPFRELLQYDVVFIYGNPRLLSNVASSLLLKWRKKTVVIWGQAHTATANSYSETLRLLWWRCFRNLLVYTDGERDWLESKGFHSHNIVGINNGLDQKKIDSARQKWPVGRLDKWKKENCLQGRRLLLSCARLVGKNKFEDGVDMLGQLVDRGLDPIWAVIGSGPEEERLKQLAHSKGLADNVIWAGPLYQESDLAPWFLSADLFIHPSAIGLSLLHAMGYGLPVITHANPSEQMPEFAAFIDGETGLLFKPGDITDFAKQTIALLDNPDRRRKMGRIAERITRTQYNTDIMAKRFQVMVASALAGKAAL